MNIKYTVKNILLICTFSIAVLICSVSAAYAGSASDATGSVDSWNGAYIRSAATTSSSKVVCLVDNASLKIHSVVFTTSSSTATTDMWYSVTTESGLNGYIRADLVDNIKYNELVGTTTEDLNYRSGAGTGMTKKGCLYPNTEIKVLLNAKAYGSDVDWYLVSIDNSHYYVCSTWVSVKTPAVIDEAKAKAEAEAKAKEEAEAKAKAEAEAEAKAKEEAEAKAKAEAEAEAKAKEEAEAKAKAEAEAKAKAEAEAKAKEEAEAKAKEEAEAEAEKTTEKTTKVISTPVTKINSVTDGTGNVDSWNGAYVRSIPSTSGSRVALLGDNAPLTIHKEMFVTSSSTKSTDIWLYVTTEAGSSGYIRSDLVDNISYTAVSGKTTEDLNYREGAGTGMKLKGCLDPNTSLTIYAKAGAYGSNVEWYKVKIGSSYYYVCSTWVDMSETIFVDTTIEVEEEITENITEEQEQEESAEKSEEKSEETSEDTSEETSEESSAAGDSDFEAQLDAQGFPEDYKVYLRQLHEEHPNWVFLSTATGVDFNQAVTLESRDGVSLVEGSRSISLRSTDSNSFIAGAGKTIYSSAGGGTNLGTLANGESFTILDEVWHGTTQWTHIRLSNGTVGYVSGSISKESYSGCISGTITDEGYVNIRSGAGTSNYAYCSWPQGTEISIVLSTKDSDGNTWYKIKYGNGYGYIMASLCSVSGTMTVTDTVTTTVLSDEYAKGKAECSKEYRAYADSDFPCMGSFAKNDVFSILGKVKDENGDDWYRVYNNGNVVYITTDNVSVEGDVPSVSLPDKLSACTTDYLNYRNVAGTIGSSVMGCFSKGSDITVTGATKVGSDTWYSVLVGGRTYYSWGEDISVNCETAPADARPQVSTETRTYETQASASTLTGTGKSMDGTYIAKDGDTWFNASSEAVAYYMDPRNFLNSDSIYMFEDLSYHGEYQTEAVVAKVLSGTMLEANGFAASWFCEAGAKYGMSPVALAARARQETGGGSIAISGYVYNGRTVYNPFNIGAYSSDNPVMLGLQYAYEQGWYTKKDAVYGGCSIIASGYINAGQNSTYYQRFNVANGVGSIATHQYMTNLLAPYDEAATTKNTYESYGITDEALTFVIPIYNNMPATTVLP